MEVVDFGFRPSKQDALFDEVVVIRQGYKAKQISRNVNRKSRD
jgi:hypothetical protein